MSALTKIKKLFPNVTKVVDATKTVSITVKDIDNTSGRKKDFGDCALAKACKRTKIAEGVLIGLTTSYLIKGNVAVRYKTSNAVSREITSFDRNQYFASGKNYKLSKVPLTTRFDYNRNKPKGKGGGKAKIHPQRIHKTADVRQLKQL